jgi:hypothetical protein
MFVGGSELGVTSNSSLNGDVFVRAVPGAYRKRNSDSLTPPAASRLNCPVTVDFVTLRRSEMPVTRSSSAR